MSTYYKDKTSSLVIEILQQDGNFHRAKVVVAANEWEVGEEGLFRLNYFEPCEKPNLEPPRSTQTGNPMPNYTKDVELRLECLKLAVHYCKGSPNVTPLAKTFYDWITSASRHMQRDGKEAEGHMP